MAKSREIPTQDPVVESESEESETEESESESESEPVKKATAPPQKPVAKAPAPAATSSDEESGSEYETDSESDSPPKPEPVAATQLKKPSSSSVPAAVAVKTPAKRSALELETPAPSQDTKRPKKEATEEGKKLFERVFNPEDQITVLEELIKRYPISIKKDSPQMDDLYEGIRGRLSVPASKAQIQNKIRSLRLKFFNKRKIAQEKSGAKTKDKRKKKDSAEENGNDETETRVYELSSQLWANEEGPKSARKGPPKIALRIEEPVGKDEKEVTVGKDEKKEVRYTSNDGPAMEWVFGEGTKLVAEQVRGELEQEWRRIRKEEARLLVEKLEVSLKHAKEVYNSL